MKRLYLRVLVLFLFGVVLCLPEMIQAQQARIRFDNNAWMVIDNGAALVIDNPSPAAITLGPGGGNISSEAENDRIHWNIGTNSGSYIIPWTSPNGFKMPLVHGITTPGTGAGHYIFSTYTDNDAVDNWNNFDYRPSDVTNMGGSGIPNNSDRAIDRFWIIDPENYTTPPATNMTFFYDDAERTAAGNNIPAGTMRAQRFDPGLNAWEVPGFGVDNFPTQTVTTVILPAVIHRSWTLATFMQPLPAEDLSFFAKKEGAGAFVWWEVEELANHMAYAVQRSHDAQEFETIARIDGESFNYYDPAPLQGLNHYRLQVVDQNGALRHSEIRTLNFGGLQIEVWPNPGTGQEMQLGIYGGEGRQFSVELFGIAGKMIRTWSIQPESGNYQQALLQESTNSLPNGVYLLRVSGEDGNHKSFRVLIQD